MSSQRVVLVRHGETKWSRSHRHTGRTDIPLTERGREQAARAGRVLAGRSFVEVLTSPLDRARDTCAIAGFADRAEEVADLAEWDYGAAEGRSTADIQVEVPGWTVWTHPVGGDGESLDAVGARADAVVARLAAADGDVLVFAHGHLLRVLASRWLGLPAAGGRLLLLGTAAISTLGHEHGTRALETWNNGSHLQD